MAEQPKYERIKLTNKAPGPRTIFTANGGHTLQKGESKTIPLTENDYKGLKPYLDLGHLEAGPGDPEEDTVESTDLGGEDTTGNPVEGAKNLGVDIVPTNQAPEPSDDEPEYTGPDSTDGEGGEDSQESQGEKPTHVEHRGFGRWYGMQGEERVTPAMTEAEADAYAEENGIAKKTAQDPSDEVQETVQDDVPPPADETTSTES